MYTLPGFRAWLIRGETPNRLAREHVEIVEDKPNGGNLRSETTTTLPSTPKTKRNVRQTKNGIPNQGESGEM